MTNAILLFIAGLVMLIVGADLLVRGASRLAAAFGVSPLVLGLPSWRLVPLRLRSLFRFKQK